ncbi:hypothetical protein CDAR_174311 [Caerostris darwini]|uniref:Uncharacterized protein n=1 Tax=Caerostris darwini TaxID=1538125 RepID=A0AAV4VHQ0_9ARAC|nr:hypothetical protein CDAR_174311 [Caerostris darwini]
MLPSKEVPTLPIELQKNFQQTGCKNFLKHSRCCYPISLSLPHLIGRQLDSGSSFIGHQEGSNNFFGVASSQEVLGIGGILIPELLDLVCAEWLLISIGDGAFWGSGFEHGRGAEFTNEIAEELPADRNRNFLKHSRCLLSILFIPDPSNWKTAGDHLNPQTAP